MPIFKQRASISFIKFICHVLQHVTQIVYYFRYIQQNTVPGMIQYMKCYNNYNMDLSTTSKVQCHVHGCVHVPDSFAFNCYHKCLYKLDPVHAC